MKKVQLTLTVAEAKMASLMFDHALEGDESDLQAVFSNKKEEQAARRAADKLDKAVAEAGEHFVAAR